MQFIIATLAAPALFAATANAARIKFCYEADFQGQCMELDAPWDQCLYVPSDLNDHVYSAVVTEGYGCWSYATECDPVEGPLQFIDTKGYSGLPDGHRTSAFGCDDCYGGGPPPCKN